MHLVYDRFTSSCTISGVLCWCALSWHCHCFVFVNFSHTLLNSVFLVNFMKIHTLLVAAKLVPTWIAARVFHYFLYLARQLWSQPCFTRYLKIFRGSCFTGASLLTILHCTCTKRIEGRIPADSPSPAAHPRAPRPASNSPPSQQAILSPPTSLRIAWYCTPFIRPASLPSEQHQPESHQ